VRHKSISAAAISAALAATAFAAEKAPLYFLAAATPYRTVTAQTDEEFKLGDLATVAGRWQAGGTAAGAVLLCRVNEPAADKRGLLAAPPVDVRYFYLDAWPGGAPPKGLSEWARAQGIIADAGLYQYGFIVRPSVLEPLAAPAADEGRLREWLAARRKDIRKVKLDLITGEPHHPYNKGYKVVADTAAAEITVENVDYEKGVAVARARLERLPPKDSDTLFRYLDVYAIIDMETQEIKWAVVCVGGFFLE